MKISDLKQKRASQIEEITAIRSIISDENRVLTDDELAKVDTIEKDIQSIDRNIEVIEKEEEMARDIAVVDEPKKEEKEMKKTSLELVRQLVENNGKQTDDILDVNRNLAENVSSNGVFIERNYSYGTNGADLSKTGVGALTVTEHPESAAIWKKMGVTEYPSLHGGTQKLPFMATITGADIAEKGSLTRTQTPTNHVELTPVRTGVTIEVTREGLATYSEATWNGVMANVLKAIDRKISAKIYDAVLAGATSVTGVALDKAGFDALEAAVPTDGVFFMERATFFEAKAVAVDAGSGKFLVTKSGQDMGETEDGTTIFHSGLFADPANEKYVAYGIPSQIALGFWGNDAYEVIVDPYTKAKEGTLVITVSKINDVKIPDADVAFSISPDLDPAA